MTTIRTHSTHTHKYTVFSHTLHVSTLIECIVDACMIGTGTISAATLWFDDGQLHVYQCLGIVWAILRIFEGNFQQLLGHFGSCLGNLWASLGYFGGFFRKTPRNRPRGRAKKLARSSQFRVTHSGSISQMFGRDAL